VISLNLGIAGLGLPQSCHGLRLRNVLVLEQRMKVEGDPGTGIAGPSPFICPDPGHASTGKPTKGINELIPMCKAPGFREMPTKGQGSIVIPGPLGEEGPVGSNEIALLI
jgi:hypothetical protein